MRIVEKPKQPTTVKTFGNNTSNIIFYDNGSVAVFEDRGREGGCVMARNTYDELHLFENDAEFIRDLLSYCRKEIPHQYEALSDYLDTLDWVYTARNNATLSQNPNLTLEKTSFDVINRINRNDYVITDAVDTLEEAKDILANSSDYRPSGKPPILGSGRIRERFFYKNEKGETLEYAHIVFLSHENCRPEHISAFEREVRRIK